MSEIPSVSSTTSPERTISNYEMITIFKNGAPVILLDYDNDIFEIPKSTFNIVKNQVTIKCIMDGESIDDVMSCEKLLKIKLLGSKFSHDHPQAMISQSICHSLKKNATSTLEITDREWEIWMDAVGWFFNNLKEFCSTSNGSVYVNLKSKMDTLSECNNMFDHEINEKLLETINISELASEFDNLGSKTEHRIRLPGPKSKNRYIMKGTSNDNQSLKRVRGYEYAKKKMKK